jgi:hypothetical protein
LIRSDGVIKRSKGHLLPNLLVVMAAFALSGLYTYFSNSQSNLLMEGIFSLPLLFTMLGFSLTMFVFLNNSVNAIKSELISIKKKSISRNIMFKKLDMILSEIGCNVWFIFISIILILVDDIIGSLSIAEFYWPFIFGTILSKTSTLLFLRVFFILLVLYTLADILLSITGIIKISSVVVKVKLSEKEKNN